ncbi:hypothetical protein MUY27_00600 [Mucilaginibacter sp. RS28]|uniref:Phosphatidate cytidylyltransferase n=1 Tax=Mucilaginibacter straminoryzae TaxID=2932774 RepID=A0A9X2B765_9SPHI|nr:hypothetical protein [Mucilaginibacter straminoryzae]MCJ8208184.1 hypothetical protein [Mucilaginibacter straminoryzae]
MKKLTIPSLLLVLTVLSSCRVIGDIFKAGVYVGVIVVVVIVGLIIWLISKFRG